jgi:hypothetical protein
LSGWPSLHQAKWGGRFSPAGKKSSIIFVRGRPPAVKRTKVAAAPSLDSWPKIVADEMFGQAQHGSRISRTAGKSGGGTLRVPLCQDKKGRHTEEEWSRSIRTFFAQRSRLRPALSARIRTQREPSPRRIVGSRPSFFRMADTRWTRNPLRVDPSWFLCV